jgi:hypothetical protein
MRAARPPSRAAQLEGKPFKDPHPERSAIASFRGYAYQAYQTIRAWLRCGEDEQILCEFGEDIAVVRRDAAGKISAVELDQIKHRQGVITLRSDAVAQAIESLLSHRRANPSLTLILRLSTISDRGREQGVDWRYAGCGLDLWDRIRGDSGVPVDACAALREFILKHRKISSESRKFLKMIDDSGFRREVVSRIFWDTGDQSYSEIQSEILALLAARPRPIVDRDEVDAVCDRLWRHVTGQMSDAEAPPLTKRELEEVLVRETAVQVDRQTVRQMASGVERIDARVEDIQAELAQLVGTLVGQHRGAALVIASEDELLNRLPSLPAVCSSRQGVIDILNAESVGRKLVWIHGWTGSGKSTLANLFVRARSGEVIWSNVRGLEELGVASRLVRLLARIQTLAQGTATIVCDDFPPITSNSRASEILRSIVREAVAREITFIVTSQGEPPSRFVSELSDSLCVMSAPSLQETEIVELLQASGLVDAQATSRWASYLGAVTGGHPQLVSARIVHARQQGWKFSSDELLAEPQTVDQVKTEARGVLTESIPSRESREMARRLSVIGGSFTRSFAIALGGVAPPLKEPGLAFDRLRGPWIEPRGDGQFALSPLLAGYAEAEFGPTGLRDYNARAASAWLHVKSVTPIQVVQMIVTALAGRSEQLLARVSAWLVREPGLEKFAEHLALLSKISLQDQAGLLEFSAPARFIFRQAQLRIAALNSDWTAYSSLDARVMELLDESSGQAFITDFRMIHFVSSSLALESPIPFSQRLRRALSVAEMLQLQPMRNEFKDMMQMRPIGDLIMAVSTKVRTADDLRIWIESLRGARESLRRKVFSAFDRRHESYSIMIGHVWQQLSASPKADWNDCLRAFNEVREFGQQNKNQWLSAAAVRASMVVLDEFLNNHEAALQLAAEARKGGCDHVLIDFGEATTRYRCGDNARAIEAVQRAERRAPSRDLPIEQIFALTYALRAASTLYARGEERLRTIESIAKRAEEVCRFIRNESFGRVAALAFKAELAWLDHLKGNYRPALTGLMDIVARLQRFPDQSHRLLRAFRLRLGHAIAWLSQGAARTDMLETPYSGWFANFEEPIPELMAKPGAPYPVMWATLAQYGALVGETQLARRGLRSGDEASDRFQYYIGALQSADALFSCDLIDGRLQSAAQTGLNYARLLSVGGVTRKKQQDWPPLTEKVDIVELYDANKTEIDDNVAGNIPTFVLAPVLMAAFARESTAGLDFGKLADIFESAVGARERITESIDLVRLGYRAHISEEDDAVEAARAIANEQHVIHEDLKIFRIIFGSGLKSVSPREALGFQATGLDYAARLRGSHWSAIFCRMIRHRWTEVARKQAFNLIAPKISAQGILDAASPRLFGVPQCANLLRVAASAVGARWSEEAVRQLNSLSA